MSDTRAATVETALQKVRETMTGEPSREKLEIARQALEGLAAQENLWSATDYPDPEDGVRQARYLVAQDDPQGLTLYLNVMRRGNRIMPHDHTTWACVAAVKGTETNVLWERVDDGSAPGKAELRPFETIVVGPDATKSVALMPDDIHDVEIKDDDIIRHLHMYGRPLETLTGRTRYDPDAGTCGPMPVGVKTRT